MSILNSLDPKENPKVRVQFEIDSSTRSRAKHDLGVTSSDNTYQISSSFYRELQFVSHHCIHHMAMIKILCHNLKVDIPDNFGVAPSTQNFTELYLMSSKIKE